MATAGSIVCRFTHPLHKVQVCMKKESGCDETSLSYCICSPRLVIVPLEDCLGLGLMSVLYSQDLFVLADCIFFVARPTRLT